MKNTYKINSGRLLLLFCLMLFFLTGNIPLTFAQGDECCPPQPCTTGGAQAGLYGLGGDEKFVDPCANTPLPFFESFDGGFPGCWEILDFGSLPETWQHVPSIPFLGSLDGTPFMFVESQSTVPSGFMNEILLSPKFNGLEYVDMQLQFDHALNVCCGTQAMVGVWVNELFNPVAFYNSPVGNFGNPSHENLNLTPFLAPDMQVAFIYNGPGNTPEFWGVDNPELSGTPSGGGGGGCDPVCGPDAYEPNNEPGNAHLLSIAGSYTYPKSRICPVFDKDWFKYNNPNSKHTLTVKLEKLPADLDVELFGSDCQRIAISNQTGTTDELITLPNAPAGTYFIKVYGKGFASSTSPYALSVSTTAPAITSGTIKPSPFAPRALPSPLRDSGLQEESFSAYPNPTNGELNLVFQSAESQTVQLSVFDLPGRKVLEHQEQVFAGNNLMQKDLSFLGPGTYLIRLQSKQQIFTKKIVVSRP